MATEPAGTKPVEGDLPSFRLDGRLAVITGSSEGMGREFALAYSRAGAEVVLASRNREKLLGVQSAIQAIGGTAHVLTADLSNLSDIHALAHGVTSITKGRELPLVLVNCAGFAFTKPALDVTEQDWNQVLDIHGKGTFFCSQLIGRLMIERGYGKIINLSSTWSTSTDLGKSVYGFAKAGVSYLTAALSTEWAPSGVRVNALAPTATLTDNTSRNFRDNPERAQSLLSRITLGRFAQPSDMIGAAIFLASPASDFITGHTLYVDGGWHANS
jgi:NAD(P)-dependent dehydrogenase (short-subunit alcohol dehydrogenase family)